MTYGTGTESNGSEKDVEATRRLMDQIRAGSKKQKGSSDFNQKGDDQKPKFGQSPPTDGVQNGGDFSGGKGQRSVIILLLFLIILLLGFIFSTRNIESKVEQVKSVEVKQFVSEAKVASSQKDLQAKESELNVAELNAKIAEAKAREAEALALATSNSVKKSQDSLRNGGSPSTFDCSTIEKKISNFLSSTTIEPVQGEQVLLKGGCAKVVFNHDVTFLQGEGYVITFDSIDDPNPHMCGSGSRGRNDSPSTCIKYLNDHKGETFLLVDKDNDSYLKVGG